MDYICVDRGSDRCPCILMEAGQCYTCNMIQKGKCDCGSLWQGVCPYTEYIQRNKKAVLPNKPREATICKIKSYSPTLTVMTLEVPLPYGIRCKELGAFLMIRWKEWFLPISVLKVDVDYKGQRSFVDLAINATGPKTIGLLKESVIGGGAIIKGPFYSGVLGREMFDKRADSIVIAKGLSVMPLINIKEMLLASKLKIQLDNRKLPEEFLEEYLKGIEYRSIDLDGDAFEVAETLKEEYGYSYGTKRKRPNIFLMVSPYYVEKILKLTSLSKSNLIIPNHSNMCCGEGYCGSCSHNDEEGRTVRGCKCLNA